jgi:hypothetical protein
MTYLPRNGREYFHWTFTGLPDGAVVEASIGGQWHPLTVNGATGQLLLAGPDADPSGAVPVLVDEYVVMRVTDNPEIVIRDGGWINLA